MPRVPTTGNTKRPRSKGFHGAIGDLLVRLAPSDGTPYVVSAPQSEPPRVNTGQTAEEFIGVDGQVFARADFTGGEGLAWAHRVDPTPNDIRRFWDSTNVSTPISDPGTPLFARMSNEWRLWNTATFVIGVVTVPSNESVCIAEEGTFTILKDLDAPNPTVVATGVVWPNAPVFTVAGLGDRVYAVNGTTTIAYTDSTGATGTEAAPGGNWVRMWEAKGRLFLAEAQGGSLWEWQPGTDPVEVTAERTITPDDYWTTVIDAGAYIAAGATDGRIYFFGPASLEDPALVLYSSTPMPQDERIEAMAFNQGVLLISTEEVTWDDEAPGNERLTGRLYQARITDIVTNVELIKRYEGIDQPVPRHMVTTRDSIFFTTGDGTYAEVWRFLLPTLGLFREDRFPTGGAAVTGLANPGQITTLATVDEVWLETGAATEEPSWLIMAGADFFTASPKAWHELRAAFSEMPTNSEVALLTSNEPDALYDWQHPSWVVRRVVREDIDEVAIPLTGVYGRYLFVQVRMKRGANFRSPRLVSVTAIGRTDDEDQVEMTLPVIVSDHIERPYRKPTRINGLGNLLRQRLFSLKGDSVIVELYRPPMKIVGTVTAVQARAPYITRRGHVLDVAQVLVRGTRQTAAGQGLTGGPGTLGVGWLGVEPTLGGVLEDA